MEMAPDTVPSTTSLQTSKIKVPQHVVYRSFPSETVVLNLQTGRYHGLNATAGSMLEALERAPSLRDAAAAVAGDYGQPQAVVEEDMCELCSVLLARGLVELDGDAAH
jgi:Coenzyme PQQ synthesis protein D (PqqD)